MTTQLALFDYTALDTETRIVVQQRTTEIKALMKRAATDIIEIGQKLIEVKARLGHGYFGGWLRSEFDWHQNTAGNFMRVAEKFTNFVNLDGIAPSALYLLAAPSTPDSARQEAIERAETGEKITYSRATEIVTDHKGQDEDDDPLTPYEEEIAKQYNERYAHYLTDEPEPEPLSPRAQQFGVMVSSETNEWYTPAHILELARLVLGTIDLDPASCAEANQTVQASAYYDQELNGLAQPWEGRIWLNPPYGKTAGRSNQDIWAENLIAEYEGGNTTEAILLVKAALGYNWFERLWYGYPTCFVRERLYFTAEDGSGDGQAKAATAIIYFGRDVTRFKSVFQTIGRVILPDD